MMNAAVQLPAVVPRMQKKKYQECKQSDFECPWIGFQTVCVKVKVGRKGFTRRPMGYIEPYSFESLPICNTKKKYGLNQKTT